ncbi:diguanylate cyclase domain-containing protein [Actinoplanes sichuanensis]|uniref:Diguanylate cyclase domain-containing protein n=1 Tax=Actinoplanes sichuanensis TaxID=512349 RepID=A0ABW4AND8_9ACTN
MGVARTWRTASSLHRRQLATVMGAALFPVLGNAVTLIQFASGGGGDFAVLGFVVTGVVTSWAVFRQGLLKLVPVARGLIFERVSDAIVVIDVEGRVLDLDPAAADLVRLMQPDLPRNLIELPSHRLLRSGELEDREYTVDIGARTIDLDARSSDLTDNRGRYIGRVVVARDVTELNDQKRALRTALAERDALDAALRHQAFHDSLTGLANRALFTERIVDEYAEARERGRSVAVMLIDLDDFKPVNDTFGHHVGDLLLKEVAVRLTADVRDVDTVARLGGDEFAVLFSWPLTEPMETLARRMIDVLHAPCVLAGHEVRVRAGIGVAVDADALHDPDQLLRQADAAMYEAKANGKGSFAYAR